MSTKKESLEEELLGDGAARTDKKLHDVSGLGDGHAASAEGDAAFEKRYAEMFFEKDGRTPKAKSAFSRNFRLAVRGSTFVLVLGIPLILATDDPHVPGFVKSYQDAVLKAGLFDASTCVLFVYTLYFNVGSTIDLARSGLGGVVASSLLCWVQWGIYPSGVDELGWNGPTYFGFTWGICVVMGMLYLNFAKNVQVFCLSYFVFYWMDFLLGKPGAYCHSFQAPWDCFADGITNDAGQKTASHTSEMATMVKGFGGVCLAVVATMFPKPMFAIDQARESCMLTVKQLCLTWDRTVDTYCAERAILSAQDRLVHDLAELEGNVKHLEGFLADSWWECLGSKANGRARVMMSRLDTLIHENSDRLRMAFESCMREDYGELHKRLMNGTRNDGVRNELQLVIDKAKGLYAFCTVAAIDGDINKEETETIEALVQETQDAIDMFSEKFRKHRKNELNVEIKEDLLDEHAFCLNVCAVGRLARTFALELLEYDRITDSDRKVDMIKEAPGLSSIFDFKVNNSKDNLSYMLRNSLSLFICMFIGYQGWKHSMISEPMPGNETSTTTLIMVVPNLDASIASTVCVLFSKSAGSALTKNLGRVQGVVLASVLGQLGFGIFGICSWFGYFMTGFLLWAWLTTTLFIYYHSTTMFSYIGCLLAAFGAGYFLTGCSTPGFNPVTGSYDKSTSVVVAITVMTVIDLIFAGKRASQMAYEQLLFVYDNLSKSIFSLSNAEERTIKLHRAELESHIGLAKAYGAEAAAEPRWWRTSWKAPLYEQSLLTAYKLRGIINCMENTAQTNKPKKNAAKGDPDNRPKNRVFQKSVAEMVNLREAGMKFQAQLKEFKKIFQIFMHEKEGDLNKDMTSFGSFHTKFCQDIHAKVASAVIEDFPKSWHDNSLPADADAQYGAVVRKLLQSELQQDREGGGSCVISLEQDPTCQVSFQLSCIRAMMYEMQNLQHSILRQ